MSEFRPQYSIHINDLLRGAREQPKIHRENQWNDQEGADEIELEALRNLADIF